MKKPSAKIARTWHGVVPEIKSEAYYRYLLQTGIKDYESTPGNCGIQMLRRIGDGYSHFLLITFWDSYDSIRDFAGNDIERARYYPEDQEYLIDLEPNVTHYEIMPIGVE